MTCTELRSLVEGSASATGLDRHYSAEAAEHLGACAECSRLSREWTELRGLLEAVRNAAPQISASLDCAVLDNFRKRAQGVKVATGVVLLRPSRLPAAPFWRAAIAAVALLAVTLPLAYRTSSSSRHPRQAVRAVASPPSVADQAPFDAPKANIEASPGAAAHRAQHKANAPGPEVSAPDMVPWQFPPGFNSLMYCDPLSCSGTMEVIRMQIPSPLPGRGSERQSERVVFADIIVGPDGVARGIRFVE